MFPVKSDAPPIYLIFTGGGKMPNYIYTTDNEQEFLQAVYGLSALLALWEMDQWFRHKLKYEQLSPEADKEIEEGREELHRILHNKGIDLDHLMD